MMLRSSNPRSLVLVTICVLIPSKAWAITPGILFPPASTAVPTIVPPGETYQGEFTAAVIPKSVACGATGDHNGRVVTTYGDYIFAISTYPLTCAETPTGTGCSTAANDLTTTYFDAPYPSHPVGEPPCTLEYGYCNCTGTPGSTTEGPINTDGQVVRTGGPNLLVMKFSTYTYRDPATSCANISSNANAGTIATWTSSDCGDTWEFGQYLDGTSPPSSTLPFVASVDRPEVYVDQFTTPLNSPSSGSYHKVYMFSAGVNQDFSTEDGGFFWVYEQTGSRYSALFREYFPVYNWVRLASPFPSAPSIPVVMTTAQDTLGNTRLFLLSCPNPSEGTFFPVLYWSPTTSSNEYTWNMNYVNTDNNCYITTPMNLAGDPANNLPNISLARGTAAEAGLFYIHIVYPVRMNNSNTNGFDEQLFDVVDATSSWTGSLNINSSSFILAPNSNGLFSPPGSTWHGGLVQSELFELSPTSPLADVTVLYWENSYNPEYGFGTITAEARFSTSWGVWPTTGTGSRQTIGTTFFPNFPILYGTGSSGDYDRGVSYYDGTTLKFFLPWMQSYGSGSSVTNNLTYNILTATSP